MRSGQAFGIGLAGLFLLTSVSDSDGGEPKSGGTLRVPLTGDTASLDPARCYELPGEFFVRVIYQGLLDYDDGINLVPVLSKSWSVSPDGLNYTFELDPSARFSNGRAVVASDYVFSFERMLSPKMHCPADFLYFGISGVKEYRAGMAAHISGIRASKPQTLKIELLAPDLTFLFRLAMPFAAPICEELLPEKFADVGTVSAGAGPFKLKQWIRGASLQLIRNPFYGGSSPAFVDRINAMIGIRRSGGPNDVRTRRSGGCGSERGRHRAGIRPNQAHARVIQKPGRGCLILD